METVLLCNCSDGDLYDYAWVFDIPTDFTKFEGARRKRCSSCRELIDIGTDCLCFSRRRAPRHEVEIAIYGEEYGVPLAPHRMCEKCGEIYLNLEDAGLCLSSEDDMRECMQEYHKMTGFKPQQSIEEKDND
ncbi:MAG: hypothetical protein GY816_23345 [Cytophagales bacterium]|nr:hypothetical protein [Cytophagales bacterium]